MLLLDHMENGVGTETVLLNIYGIKNQLFIECETRNKISESLRRRKIRPILKKYRGTMEEQKENHRIWVQLMLERG